MAEPLSEWTDDPLAAVRSPELRRGGRRDGHRRHEARRLVDPDRAGGLAALGRRQGARAARGARRDRRRLLARTTAPRSSKWCGADPRARRVRGARCAGSAGTARSTSRTAPSTCCARSCSRTCSSCTSAITTAPQIGNLMARANLDLRQINQLVVFVPVFAANVVMVIAILAVLFTLNVKLTLLALISFPLLAVGAAWFQKLLDPVAARLQERLAEVSEVVEEGVAGIRVREGFRRRAGGEGPARRARRAGPRRSGRAREAARHVQPDARPAADGRARDRALRRRQGRDRRIAHRRRPRRVQRAAAPARVPAAHDVVRRRAGRAGIGVGRARAGGDGHRAARSPTTSRCRRSRRARARCRSRACRSRTTAPTTCCATSTSRSRAASRSRWSGRPDAARARWRG